MLKLLRHRKFRDAAVQVAFISILVATLSSAILTGRASLEEQGITSGFSFLDRSTGFDVGFSLIEFTPYDTYGKMIWVGLLNTMFLGVIGIGLANVIGMTIAIFRLSANATMNFVGKAYVETFRNIPLILQVVFWYSILTNFPRPKNAYVLFDSFFLTARGIFTPGLNVGGGYFAIALSALVVGLGICIWLSWSRRFNTVGDSQRRLMVLGVFGLSTAAALIVLYAGRIPDTPLVSFPILKGLNFKGGGRLPPELSALAIGMGIYGGAYISEILRAGFLSVGKGQTEAARSLGLSPWQVFTRVRLPLAFRAVLPTLINQYVWLFKATTLGIAVGFTDFFSVVSVSITQSGQTLELIAILMGGFLVMNNAIALVLNRLNKAIALRGTQLRI